MTDAKEQNLTIIEQNKLWARQSLGDRNFGSWATISSQGVYFKHETSREGHGRYYHTLLLFSSRKFRTIFNHELEKIESERPSKMVNFEEAISFIKNPKTEVVK